MLSFLVVCILYNISRTIYEAGKLSMMMMIVIIVTIGLVTQTLHVQCSVRTDVSTFDYVRVRINTKAVALFSFAIGCSFNVDRVRPPLLSRAL